MVPIDCAIIYPNYLIETDFTLAVVPINVFWKFRAPMSSEYNQQCKLWPQQIITQQKRMTFSGTCCEYCLCFFNYACLAGSCIILQILFPREKCGDLENKNIPSMKCIWRANVRMQLWCGRGILIQMCLVATPLTYCPGSQDLCHYW